MLLANSTSLIRYQTTQIKSTYLLDRCFRITRFCKYQVV